MVIVSLLGMQQNFCLAICRSIMAGVCLLCHSGTVQYTAWLITQFYSMQLCWAPSQNIGLGASNPSPWGNGLAPQQACPQALLDRRVLTLSDLASPSSSNRANSKIHVVHVHRPDAAAVIVLLLVAQLPLLKRRESDLGTPCNMQNPTAILVPSTAVPTSNWRLSIRH